MYERNYWLNHVEDETGGVVQEGTPLDQDHFNPMEEGISDAHLATKLLSIAARWGLFGGGTDGATSEEVKDIKDKAEQNASAIEGLQNTQQSQGTQITNQGKTLSEHTTAIENLQKTQKTQGESITNLDTRLGTLEQTSTNYGRRLDALEKAGAGGGGDTTQEVQEITITAGSDPWPFGITTKSVTLGTVRKNTNYTVDAYVKSYSGGALGDVVVSDKGTNNFKVKHDGSATTVTLVLKITGGMQ
nr:MAG TPA: Protein of unknown function DUF16 [Caudoviricetes sp.]